MKHLTLLILLGAVSNLDAQNWPQWRGPDQNGISREKGFPTKWSKTENILWSVPLPGRSGSTPVVWNDQIFLTTPKSGKNVVASYDMSGKLLWETEIGQARKGKHRAKGSATHPSPVTDGEQVFVYFRSGDAAALDFDGKIKWEKNLHAQHGRDTLWWDMATSPVLTSEHVVFTKMDDGKSWLLALDRNSGEQAWKQDRFFKTEPESDHAYTTPVVHTGGDGKELIIVLGADHVTAHAADTGSEVWRYAGLNPGKTKYWRCISSPVVGEGLVFAPYARGKQLTAIKLGGKGDITESHKAWVGQRSADVPSPLVVNGRAYVCEDRGFVTCFDVKSGKQLWRNRIGGSISTSPVLADGRIYVLREKGTMVILEEGATFKLVATNSLDGEWCLSSPVPVKGKFIIRTAENLICIGKAGA
ncbi:MAG: PQQ-binding-like beta-propeller repeat protein [Planctomycetota bacterium]|nr:PQQ-binding-like beta-propeller repeat protein [Planctomycetota bacterium]